LPVINQDWYDANEGRLYPLDDTATPVDASGTYLPSDILADLQLRWPSEYGEFGFLSAVSVTAALVTLAFEAADDVANPSTFRPLAVLTAVQPLVTHRHLLLSPQAQGVGGWAVLGRGAMERQGYRARFPSPRAGLLTRRAARAYRPLPVTGLREYVSAALLQGVVTLRADPPLYLRKEQRDVDGVNRDVIVMGLTDSASGDQVSPGALDALTPAAESVFAKFAGPCAGRPESGNCGDPQPIEFVNSVAPDCEGTITLQFQGCASVAQILGQCGVVLECRLGLTDVCPPDHLPDAQGSLPDEVAPAVSVSDSSSCK
jgi:hypothetical protein